MKNILISLDFLDCHKTDPEYIFGYSKLRRLGTVFKQVGHETLTQRNEIFMDSIILDNVPNGRINRIVHAKVCNIIKMFLNAQLNVGSKNKWIRLKSRCLMLFPKNAVFDFLNFFEKINNKKYTELCRVYTYTLQRADGAFRQSVTKNIGI